MSGSQHKARSLLVPTIAAALGLGITVSACIWQYGRGVEKDRIAAEIEAANQGAEISVPGELVKSDAWVYRKVRVKGEFLPAALVLHDNQIHAKRVGYNVYGVLKLSNGKVHCLIKRGWVVAPPDRKTLPEVVSNFGEVEISGLALPPVTRFLELSASTSSNSVAGSNVWQNVTVERVAQAFGLALQPFVIEQHSDTADGLTRQWPAPVSSSAKHYGYAFQWGGMAALIAVLYVFFYVRRKSKQA